MKKLLSIILVLALMISFSVSAFATDDDNTTTETNEKTESPPPTPTPIVITEPTTVEFPESNSSTEEPIEIGSVTVAENSGAVNIDLNGNTVEIVDTTGSNGTQTNGAQLNVGSDVTVKDGTIILGEADDPNDPNDKEIKIGIQNYSNLTIDNVTIGAKESVNNGSEEGAADEVHYILSTNNGKVVIKEGTEIIADGTFYDTTNNVGGDQTAIAIYDWSDNAAYAGGTQVTIEEGATVVGKITVDASQTFTKPVEDETTKDETAEGGTNEGGTNEGEAAAAAEAAAPECKTSLTINGGVFENFTLVVTEKVEAVASDIIHIFGGLFNFSNEEEFGAEDLGAYIDDDHDIKEVTGTDAAPKDDENSTPKKWWQVFKKETKPATPSKPAATAAPKYEEEETVYYAPVVEEKTAEVISSKATEVEVNGEKIEVSIASSKVEAEVVAPVTLASNKPAEVKIAVELSALSAASDEEAVEILEALAENIAISVKHGDEIDEEDYELVLNDKGELTVKLSAELLKTLGKGKHIIVIEFAGLTIECTVVVK